jgi:hypothetical protein
MLLFLAVPTLSEPLKYTGPQLAHLEDGDKNSASLRGLRGELNKITYSKHLIGS